MRSITPRAERSPSFFGVNSVEGLVSMPWGKLLKEDPSTARFALRSG